MCIFTQNCTKNHVISYTDILQVWIIHCFILHCSIEKILNMLVSQEGVRAKNYTVKIMTIDYRIKNMEVKFLKPNRRKSLDVRWHRPLERSVTCTCCKEKFSSPIEWPIFRRRNIVTIIRNLKKKKCICKIIGAVYKLNNTVSKTHFHLDCHVCQTCTGEFWT